MGSEKKITKDIRKYSEFNKYGNTKYQNSWYSGKGMHRGEIQH